MARTAEELPISKTASPDEKARLAFKNQPQIKATNVQGAYDAIAQTWDDNRRRPFSPLPLFAEEFQRRFSNRSGRLFHARILDAGCGNARNTVWLSKKLPRACISCCDSSTGMLRSASKNIIDSGRSHSCIVFKADLGAVRHLSSRFDAVLCTAVIHHIPNKPGWVRALSEINRLLKHNGFAFVTVWSDPRQKPGTDKEVEFPTGKGGKINRYYHFFSKSELEAAANAAGFEVSDIFYEACGRRTDAKNKSKARNLCIILQKGRRNKTAGQGLNRCIRQGL